MLKERILTALFLIPLVVGGVYWVNTDVLAWILAAIVLLGTWEWTRLMGLTQTVARIGYLLLMVILLYASSSLRNHNDLLLPLMAIVMLVWCLAVGWIIVLNRNGPVEQRQLPLLVSSLMGIWLLVPTWLAILWLHGHTANGPLWVFLLMVLIWGADSGAYFAGRQWGRHKLAVQVSPGKTWEGVSGGAVMALVIVLPFTAWLVSGTVTDEPIKWPAYIALCLITIAFSVSGDLLESVAKRRAGVKDSGQILPGHGGVLDRIDSLTAAAPCFTLGLMNLMPGGGG